MLQSGNVRATQFNLICGILPTKGTFFHLYKNLSYIVPQDILEADTLPLRSISPFGYRSLVLFIKSYTGKCVSIAKIVASVTLDLCWQFSVSGQLLFRHWNFSVCVTVQYTIKLMMKPALKRLIRTSQLN